MTTSKKRITISLTEEKIKDFEILVKKMGLTKSALVTIWIQKEFEKQNK
ncbi:MAG: transcriptional regulator [Veillonella sp.]|nr:transcriptional regulator [Veillonella sp.]MBS6327973.1 transcriptional regulator [Veillonella sp.]